MPHDQDYALKRDRPTVRLAHKLVEALSPIFETTIDPPRIDVATGYYRQKRADVMPWTASVSVEGIPISIGSWDTVTDCLRRGFTVEDCRGQGFRSYANFEIHANEKPKV